MKILPTKIPDNQKPPPPEKPQPLWKQIWDYPDGERRPVTRQLRVFKAAELALRVTLPWVHRLLRALYDAVGPSLARRIGNRTATLAHFLLTPCQLVAEAWLFVCFLAPEVLIETTYVD